MSTAQPNGVALTCVGPEARAALEKIIQDLATAYHLKAPSYHIFTPNPPTLAQVVLDPQHPNRYYTEINAVLRQTAAAEGVLLTGVDTTSNIPLAQNIAATRAVKACTNR